MDRQQSISMRIGAPEHVPKFQLVQVFHDRLDLGHELRAEVLVISLGQQFLEFVELLRTRQEGFPRFGPRFEAS